MNNFITKFSDSIYFGEGIAEEALKQERKVLGSRTLLLMGRSLSRMDSGRRMVDFLSDLLGQGNVCVFSEISPNPDLTEVEKAAEIGKKYGVTSVIGFGGGSVIDAAKAAALGISSNIPLREYLLQGTPVPDEALPVIALPTTAGTGAELSRGAIISSRADHMKGGIRGDAMVPALAIVDPTFTWTVPAGVTMESGFDVFAHAAESYLSKKATLFSEMISEKVIRIVGENLRILAVDLNDHEARRQMAFASDIVGINLRNVGNCLPHRLQYPIGANSTSSHGAGLAALYPAWLEEEFSVQHEKVNDILTWLQLKKCETGEEVRGQIGSFLKDIRLMCRIPELGCNESPEDLALQVRGDISSDPLAVKAGIIETIYRESM